MRRPNSRHRRSFRLVGAGLLLALLLVACSRQPAPEETPVQVEGLQPAGQLLGLSVATTPDIALQAQRDVAGDDLRGKDGPLVKVGFDLALLYREHQAFLQQGGAGTFSSSNSLHRISGDRIVIDAVASGEAAALLADLTALGLTGGSSFGRVVSGRLPIGAIADMAALGSLQFARASAATTNVGSVTSQGDKAMRSDVARTTFSVDGSGQVVGVLSDSYDCKSGAAADITSGDLPASPNILKDKSSCSSGTDEGRAMMQLVFDVAPGANLAFYTAFEGIADFATGITKLAAPVASGGAGATVVVDDVIYFTELMFQDGIVAQAADGVAMGGVPYFSSAGNAARRSYEDTFRATGTVAPGASTAVVGTDAHDFDPGPGVDICQAFTVPSGSTVIFSFQWDSPSASAGGLGSPNDMDIFLYTGPTCTTLITGASGTTANIGGDAVELAGVSNGGPTVDIGIVIAQNVAVGGPPPDKIKYVYFGPSTSGPKEFATSSSTVYGHAGASHAVAVGSAFYGDTPEFGTTPPLIESFSSAGPTTIFFDPAGTPMTEVRDKPEITAPDGTNTTFFGSDISADTDTFPNFFGTSAAAPHAAGVAALMLQNKPSLTPHQIRDALMSTAIDMGPSGFDPDTGAGFIQADKALGANTNPGTLSFSMSSYTVGEGGSTATITATRSGGSFGSVTVDYATSDGSATAGSDYTASSGMLGWANGDTADKAFTVPITDDSLAEGDETVNLTLSNPTGGATLGTTSSATLTIQDNEPSSATLSFGAGSSPPAATVNAMPGDEVPVLQVDADVPAGSDTVTINDLTISSSVLNGQSLGEAAASLGDIAAVNVYLDDNDNGKVDAGETKLAGGTFDTATGKAKVSLGTNKQTVAAGGSKTLLVTYEINSSLSDVGHGLPLILLLTPLGFGLLVVRRLRRLRGIPILLVVLLVLGLTACPPVKTPRSFSSSLSGVTASASTSGLTVTVNGLPLTGSTVKVDP